MSAVEIIAIGTELLLGQLLDTNTAHIASVLADAGVDVYATHTVGDNRQRITAALRAALDRADGVITTGGLGPTIDDLTKESVCDLLGCATETNARALQVMEQIFARSGRAMRENNRKQAELPIGSVVLPNDNGTAPGFIAPCDDGKFIACMPGVPWEMKPMLAEHLLPWLLNQFALSQHIYTRVLHTVNIAESEIDHRIDDLFRVSENPKIAILAHDYRCDVKIMAKAESMEKGNALILPLQHRIEERLRGHVFGVDDATLPATIHQLLQDSGRTVATAESITGGAVSEALTSTAGASKSFLGGVVAYSNAAKIEILGVDSRTLEREGAVSEQTAVAMADGARKRLRADIGISTTGVAGPTGGSAAKPVGLVWVGIADGYGVHARKLELRGDRGAIQARTVTSALALLWHALAAAEP